MHVGVDQFLIIGGAKKPVLQDSIAPALLLQYFLYFFNAYKTGISTVWFDTTLQHQTFSKINLFFRLEEDSISKIGSFTLIWRQMKAILQ